MQTTRYRFQQVLQSINTDNIDSLKEEFKHILESEYEFTRKADYIGQSINHIDAQISSIDQEIKELQALKQELKVAKSLALEVGAEVFEEYGVQRLEGSVISSITLSHETTKEKLSVEILNEAQLIHKGYVHFSLDIDQILDELQTLEGKFNLLGLATLKREHVSTSAKLKINKRRAKANITTVDIEEAA